MALSHKQEMFCQYYVATGNATAAAEQAGYSKASARVTGCQNLTKANIQERIEQLAAEQKAAAVMDREERQALLTEIARDCGQVAPDRMKAVDLLNKMDGVYINKQEVTGADGEPLVFRWAGDEDG